MRILVIAVLALFLTFSASYAASDNAIEGMAKKAGRGAVNLLTGPVELPAQIIKGATSGFEPMGDNLLSKMVGGFFGVFRGVAHAAGRMASGALELGGFWTADRADQEDVGLRYDAENSWEEGDPQNLRNPTLPEGLKPAGRKLAQGAADTFLGIFELPGQAIKGAGDGHPILGFGKGLWSWASREINGIGNLATFLLPNHQDNLGAEFDTEEPWDVLKNK